MGIFYRMSRGRSLVVTTMIVNEYLRNHFHTQLEIEDGHLLQTKGNV